MRLWSLHPRYLDRRGLVALWREGLLAQAVLRGRTKGYRQHPQLIRFRESGAPVAAVAAYLAIVHDEAGRRGYSFDGARIVRARGAVPRLPVNDGQLAFEWRHLRAKVRRRDPAWLVELPDGAPRAHPMFRVKRGPVESWERGATPANRARLAVLAVRTPPRSSWR